MTSSDQNKDHDDSIVQLSVKRRALSVSIANAKIALAKEEGKLLDTEIKLQNEWVAKGLIGPLPRF